MTWLAVIQFNDEDDPPGALELYGPFMTRGAAERFTAKLGGSYQGAYAGTRWVAIWLREAERPLIRPTLRAIRTFLAGGAQ